jgi:hypothetical protein
MPLRPLSALPECSCEARLLVHAHQIEPLRGIAALPHPVQPGLNLNRLVGPGAVAKPVADTAANRERRRQSARGQSDVASDQPPGHVVHLGHGAGDEGVLEFTPLLVIEGTVIILHRLHEYGQHPDCGRLSFENPRAPAALPRDHG